MVISRWYFSHELPTEADSERGAITSVGVETDPDGRPFACVITMERKDSNGELLTRYVEFNAGEMWKIAMEDWHLKNHEYTNKAMAENRREAGIK